MTSIRYVDLCFINVGNERPARSARSVCWLNLLPHLTLRPLILRPQWYTLEDLNGTIISDASAPSSIRLRTKYLGEEANGPSATATGSIRAFCQQKYKWTAVCTRPHANMA